MEKIMKYILYFLFSILILSCSNTKNPLDNSNDNNSPDISEFIGDYDTTYVIKDEDILLRKAFYYKSSDLLNTFFSNWHSEINPITNIEYETLNDTLKNIYQIYYKFFSPSDDYENIEYFVINTRVYVTIIDSSVFDDYNNWLVHIPDSLKVESIFDNCKPNINRSDMKFLYLNQKYNEVLNFYFNEWDGTYDYYFNMDNEYLSEKVNFLEPKILVFHEHWVRGYIYESFPQMTSVVFNNDFSRAFVNFWNSSSSGGTDEYALINSEWIFIKINSRWIT